MKTVSILGCGWLGWPLALQLQGEGFSVHGSTTDPDKKNFLEKQGIKAFLVTCSPQIECDQPAVFLNSDVLFFNVPFRRKLIDPRYYQDQFRSVRNAASTSSIQTIIFAGTTSIYPDNCGRVDEEFEIQAKNERAQVLLDIESELLNDDRFNAVILRLSGLYGGERRIGKFLAGKSNIPNASSPVNLIHLEDCVSIISKLIKDPPKDEIFNLCSDKHPQRHELYTAASQAMGLAQPSFSDEPSLVNKIIDNFKIKKFLNYEFIHPDPLEDVNYVCD